MKKNLEKRAVYYGEQINSSSLKAEIASDAAEIEASIRANITKSLPKLSPEEMKMYYPGRFRRTWDELVAQEYESRNYLKDSKLAVRQKNDDEFARSRSKRNQELGALLAALAVNTYSPDPDKGYNSREITKQLSGILTSLTTKYGKNGVSLATLLLPSVR